MSEKKLRKKAKKEVEEFITTIRTKDGRCSAFIIPFRKAESVNNDKRLDWILNMLVNRDGVSIGDADISEFRFDYMVAAACLIASQFFKKGNLGHIDLSKED